MIRYYYVQLEQRDILKYIFQMDLFGYFFFYCGAVFSGIHRKIVYSVKLCDGTRAVLWMCE